MVNKPWSPACERNTVPILEVLREQFATSRQVLEIGSGTGQHAVAFAAALPHLQWQCSDLAENLQGIGLWLDEAALPNTPPPLPVDVLHGLPAMQVDAVFTANTLHIMPWAAVQALFTALPRVLAPDGLLVVYGPFNYQGQFTSDSNAAFDAALRSADPARGLRDAEEVDALARVAGLVLQQDQAMPANNRCICWRRSG